MKAVSCADFVIVGSGVIGLSVARALAQYAPDATISILEKEKQLGMHSSGRNSGVLHAGFYYAADSQKAKFCQQGNQEWTAFCEEHGIPLL